MPKLPDKIHCTGCLACVDSCAQGAISIIIENGLRYPQIDSQKCVDCKLCERHCPEIADTNFNSKDYLLVKGGWCLDLNVRRNAASGGAFSAFALSFLQNGGFVVGASLNDDGTVTHKVIDKSEDLHMLQNSKYIQSNTCGIYKTVRKLLLSGNSVLFSGTPCQTAALNSFLGKESENLITVDVICNGVPSDDAIDLLIKDKEIIQVLSYRGKKYGWHDISSQGVTYKTKTQIIVEPDKNRDTFYKVFSCGLTHRNTCCNCHYSSLPRYADITIADFWGIKRFKEEWEDGVSLIIINNKKGLEFVNKCNGLYLFDSSLKEAVKGNPRIVNGRKFHGWHPIMLWRTPIRKFLGENIYYDIIKNKMPYKLFWGILKVMTIISNKIAIKKALNYDEKHRNNNDI